MYSGNKLKLSFINATSAVSNAVSVPLPIAKLIVAVASAGASFIPSPTIPTERYCFKRLVMACIFSVGNTFAFTSSIPTCLAIAWAVTALSPVSIAVLMPWLCRASIVFLLSERKVSATFPNVRYPPQRKWPVHEYHHSK